MPTSQHAHRRLVSIAEPFNVSVTLHGDQASIHGPADRIEALLVSLPVAPAPQPGQGQLSLFDPDGIRAVRPLEVA